MEPEMDKAFDKGMRLIAMAARDESIAVKLRGSADDRREAFALVDLTEEEVRDAATRLSEKYFQGKTEVPFW